MVRQCGISVTRCSGLAHILCPFSSCPGEDAAGSEARAHTHTHTNHRRESGCFSKGASPSTVDNQFPLHTRARTTPISQGSSPSLLNLKAEIKLRIIRASSLSTARARAHARTKSFLPSGNSLAPVERGNHRGGPLSFPRRINPCDERPLEKFEVS